MKKIEENYGRTISEPNSSLQQCIVMFKSAKKPTRRQNNT